MLFQRSRQRLGNPWSRGIGAEGQQRRAADSTADDENARSLTVSPDCTDKFLVRHKAALPLRRSVDDRPEDLKNSRLLPAAKILENRLEVAVDLKIRNRTRRRK